MVVRARFSKEGSDDVCFDRKVDVLRKASSRPHRIGIAEFGYCDTLDPTGPVEHRSATVARLDRYRNLHQRHVLVDAGISTDDAAGNIDLASE
jgi:hypothetical protein